MQNVSVRSSLVFLAVILSGAAASAKTIALWPLGDNRGNLDSACRTDARFDLTVADGEVEAKTPGDWNLPPNPDSSADCFFGSMAVRSSVKSTIEDHSAAYPVLYSTDSRLANSMYPTNAGFTVEGWIRVDTFDKSKSWRVLVQNGNGSSSPGGWTLSLRNKNDGKGYYVTFYSQNLGGEPVGASGDIDTYKFLDGTSVVDDDDIFGVWHHYAVRFEYDDPAHSAKSRWRWYVDGRLVNTYEPMKIAESDFRGKSVSSRFDLGGRTLSSDQRVKGAFSYWRVSDVPLEPTAFLNAGEQGSSVDPDDPLPETTAAYVHPPSGNAQWINTGVLVTGEALHRCTFETWVRPCSSSTSMLLCQYAGGNGRSQWLLEQINSVSLGLRMDIYINDTIKWIYFRSTRAIPVGRWSHIVFVADGDNWKFYINGKLDNVMSGFANYGFATNGNDGIVIGNTRTSNPNGYCNACFAESRVWSVVRSAEEIAMNMNVRLTDPATTDGLIGYWPLNDGQECFVAQNNSVFNYANVNASKYGRSDDRTRPCWAPATNVTWQSFNDLPLAGDLPPKQSAVKFNVYDGCTHSVNTHESEAPKNMTFTGWYMRNDTGNKENYLFGKSLSGNGRCQLRENNGKLTFWMGGGSDGATNEQFVIDDVSAHFPAGKWTQVALVKQGGTFRVYFDGNLEGEFSGFTMDLHPTAEFHIGGFNAGGSSGGYNGFVKDVGIWRKAMSQDEIRARLYTRPRGTEGSLIGYWPFDDGEGNSLRNLKVGGPAATPIDAGEGHFTWGLFANSPVCDGVIPPKGAVLIFR